MTQGKEPDRAFPTVPRKGSPQAQSVSPALGRLPGAEGDALTRALQRGRGVFGGRWSRRTALGLAVVITLIAFVASHYFGTLRDYGYAGVFLIMLISSATIILPVPGAVAIFLLGPTLNPWLLGLVAGLGGALGEVTGYMAGFGGGVVLERRPFYNRFAGWMRRRGGLAIFFVSLIGILPFDVMGIAAGALRYPLWRLLVFAALGKTPRFMLIAWSGVFGVDILRWLFGF